MPDPPTIEYVLYLRKSRGRAGIARQRTTTTGHIHSLGGTITAEFKDEDRTAFRKIGGPRPEREDFTRMLAHVAAHPGVRIAAWHADRLLRDPDDTEDLISVCREGAHLVETRAGGAYDLANANGRKRLRQDALDATYEVDHMTERITAAKTEAAMNGEWRGGRRPFGYEADGVTLRPAEAEVLAAGIRAVIGGETLGSLARQWNAACIETTTGGTWAPSQLGRCLARARNAALIEHDGQIIGPARWPAVVTEREWRAVRAVLADPARKTTPGPARRWLLSGIARCGICGGPMIGSTTGSRNGRSRPVYRCRAAGLHVGRDSNALDAHVRAVTIAFLSLPANVAAIAAASPAPDTASLRAEMALIEAELLSLADMAGERRITAMQLARSTKPLLAAKEGLEAKLAAAARPALLSPFAGHEPEQVWDAMTLDEKRVIVDGLFTVTVHPAPKGRRPGWRAGETYFDAESVKIKRRPAQG